MLTKYLPLLLLAVASTSTSLHSTAQQVVEIRSYTLQPGTRDAFHQLVIDRSLPMLQRWQIPVLGFGPSQQEDSSYYLVRTYPSLESRQQSEDAFYGSAEWKQGPRQAIVSKIRYYTTIILPADSLRHWTERLDQLTGRLSDSVALSRLNHQFIENFIRQDTLNHSAIIDPDFVCIEGDGSIVPRAAYMKDWASAYARSGYLTFTYTDETIRIFSTTALVRSKTVYTKSINGTIIKGNSIYTDTYFKRDGKWRCIQAQITPVR
ncbi:MAG TPA: DUF4440 domain-containing protein [Puia sp.]|jgi:hypothetical protein|nr:DUF4440 domain-containing protein [Puia sp.]